MATDLAVATYRYKTRPSAMLNSIFMSTVNAAARALVAAASRATAVRGAEKWRVRDHLRFVTMMMTWMTVWVLRVLMDHFPFAIGPHPYLLEGFSSVRSLEMVPFSSSSDLVLHESSDELPYEVLGSALSHILAMLNELPATSRKYQLAVAMADKLVHVNTREGHVDMIEANRTALSSAFARTSSLLYRSLQSGQTATAGEDSGAARWTSRIIGSIPLGSFLAPYLTKGIGLMFPSRCTGNCGSRRETQQALAGGRVDDVAAEKHAQELLWLTNKMKASGAVDEALAQWSLASGLASIAHTANLRVQGLIVKITAVLFGELHAANMEAPREVKFRLLAHWIPLLCNAQNGVSYPVLSAYERAEMEIIMDELISTLPLVDQEVILTNWLQDFLLSPSDWPNLEMTYDRWYQSVRELVR